MTLSAFRIHAKKILLTYSNIDQNITLQDILKLLHLKPFLKSFYYFISKELHQSGAVHFHVLLTRQDNSKFTINNHQLLDIEINGNVFHGNYQPVKYLSHTIEYLAKDSVHTTNMPNVKDGKFLSDKHILFQAAKDQGYAQALVNYAQQNVEKAIGGNSVSTLMRNFKDYKKMEDSLQINELQTPTNIRNFELKGDLKEWVDNPNLQKNKTLVLVGESGLGKTLFAKTFCNHNNLKTLVVNHKEDLQKIDHVYDAIIFDNFNFIDIERSQLLALFDNSSTKTVRVLYSVVNKKKNLVQIVTMNYKALCQLQNILTENAFARRFIAYEPQEPFIINVSYNQFNNFYNTTNNIYSSEENDYKRFKEKDQELMQRNKELITDIAKRNPK